MLRQQNGCYQDYAYCDNNKAEPKCFSFHIGSLPTKKPLPTLCSQRHRPATSENQLAHLLSSEMLGAGSQNRSILIGEEEPVNCGNYVFFDGEFGLATALPGSSPFSFSATEFFLAGRMFASYKKLV